MVNDDELHWSTETTENILKGVCILKDQNCYFLLYSLELWHNAISWTWTLYLPRLVHIIDEFLWTCCTSQHTVNVGYWALQSTARDCLEVAALPTHICSYCLLHILHNSCNIMYTNFTQSVMYDWQIPLSHKIWCLLWHHISQWVSFYTLNQMVNFKAIWKQYTTQDHPTFTFHFISFPLPTHTKAIQTPDMCAVPFCQNKSTFGTHERQILKDDLESNI